MTDDCNETRLLVQADVDGELAPAEAARVAAHVADCAGCAALQAELLALSQRLRADAPRHAASAALHAAIRARLAGSRPAPVARPRWRAAAPFGAGFALAACLALAFVLPQSGGGLPREVVTGHIRALQPGHLMDVVSTDQHTVKPWFDGRIDYAPPVKDLAAAGFPLAGARLDYLSGRPVAALVYQRRQHSIDLYVWPSGGPDGGGPGEGSRGGYNFEHWSQGGMVFWAVSDLGAAELSDFVRLWRAG